MKNENFISSTTKQKYLIFLNGQWLKMINFNNVSEQKKAANQFR